MNIGGDDLLAQIENESPKLGVYLRRYILPSIQSRGQAGQILATPADKPGPVELTSLTSLITAGDNVTVAPAKTPTSTGGVVVSAKAGVTSVGITPPGRQTASGSPVTAAGTITITDNPQPANTVFAGPAAGNPDVPAFRALVAADIPSTGGGGGSALTGKTLVLTDNETPAGGAEYDQINITSTIQGGGYNLGNQGMWSITKAFLAMGNWARRGITQLFSAALNKHAIGDSAGMYVYNRHDGGMAASSDEGASAITGQVLENQGNFIGAVVTTTGTGDTAPVLAFTSGNAWTTDGGYLLDITKGTLSGTLTGTSTALSLTINSGSVVTFLNYLTVSGASLPVSTAIGIATAAIAPGKTTRDVTVAVSVTVNLAQIGGIYKLFTNGSVVTVAGNQYPEQSIVSGASGLLAGNQQTFTLRVTNPNAQAIIFQGGIQGNYISSDANLALSGMMSAYFALGSLTGTDMIYANQVAGGVTGNILPNAGCEAWQPSGANSAWHLYPGAEVVKNTNQGFAGVLEQNGVAWAPSDTVRCARFPTAGGQGLFIVRNQYSPPNASLGWNGASITLGGVGTCGGNASGILVKNGAAAANYKGSSGPLQSPAGLTLDGQFSNCILIQLAPDVSNTNAVLFVQNPNTANSDVTSVIQLNWNAAGNLTFTTSTGRWKFSGAVDAQNGFLVNGVSGVSGTATSANTLTVVDGIITAIV